MNEKTLIYCFTGTGNSLHVAKEIANEIEGTQIKFINNVTIKEVIEDDIQKIGFIFPVYYGTLPRIIKKFIETVSFDESKYYFAIANSGSGIASAITVLSDVLKKRGLH